MRFDSLSKKRTRRLRAGIAAGVLVLISVFLLIASNQGWMSFSFLSEIPEYTVVPVKNFFVGTFQSVQGFFTDKSDLQAEILRLENELKALRIKSADLDDVRAENQRLRRLLDFQQREHYNAVAARVIAMTPGNWVSSFTIDRGSEDGIAQGMAVITPDGLVGRVVEVSDSTSVVRSIVDSLSSLAGMVERTRDHGVVNGMLDLNQQGNLLKMDYVQSDTDLTIGDRIITSGMEGIYPKGLLVGTVREISRRSENSVGYIIIRPAADFLRIEEVLVLTDPAGEAAQ